MSPARCLAKSRLCWIGHIRRKYVPWYTRNSTSPMQCYSAIAQPRFFMLLESWRSALTVPMRPWLLHCGPEEPAAIVAAVECLPRAIVDIGPLCSWFLSFARSQDQDACNVGFNKI